MSRSMLFCLQISCNMNYQNRNLLYQYINLTQLIHKSHSISYYGLIFTKKDNFLCWFRVSYRCREHGGELCPPNWGGGLFKIWWGELKSIHGGSMGGLKMLSKNNCEGVHLIVKLLAKSLQACKFTKNELYTYFSRILARF